MMWNKSNIITDSSVSQNTFLLQAQQSDLQIENSILREELAQALNKISTLQFQEGKVCTTSLSRDVGTITEWDASIGTLLERRLFDQRLLNDELDKRILFLEKKILEQENEMKQRSEVYEKNKNLLTTIAKFQVLQNELTDKLDDSLRIQCLLSEELQNYKSREAELICQQSKTTEIVLEYGKEREGKIKL